MRINNNMMAMNTHRQLGAANAGGAKSMEKLSSGMRINRAGDDAAGLAISEKMRGQIRGLNQASANAQDGISMIQTAEGALNETHAILQRMRELAVQSSTDTNVDDLDRESIQNELTQLKEEIDRIGETTEFNTQKLLKGDGSAAKEIGALQLDKTGVVAQTSLSGGKITGATNAKLQLSLYTLKGANDLAGEEFTFKFNGNSIKLNFETVATAADPKANTFEVKDSGNEVTISLVAGDTNQEFIMSKMEEAMKAAMAENANVDEANYTMSRDGAVLNVTSIAKGEGESVSVVGASSNDALTANLGPTAATSTAGAALATSVDFDADISTGITINGDAVALDAVKALGDSYAAVTNKDAVVTALQTDIDNALGSDKFKVSVGDDDKLVITSVGKGSAELATVAGADAADLGFGAPVAVAGTAGTFNAVVDTTQTAQGTAEVREKATTTIDSFSLTNLKDQIIQSGISSTNTDYFNGTDVTVDGALKFLTGKGFTIGDETVELYNSNEGKYQGTADFAVDLALAGIGTGNGALTAGTVGNDMDKILDTIESQIGNKLTNVTIESGTGDNQDKLIITAKAPGIDANSIEIKDGTDREASDVSGSIFKAQFQIGANEGQGMEIRIGDMRSEALGLKNIDLSNRDDSKVAMTTINDAINKVSNQRSELGAFQNRLEHTIKNLDNSAENLQAAEARIRDVDMAKEMMEQTKQNILAQASTAMLAQANQAPQAVLQLLR